MTEDEDAPLGFRGFAGAVALINSACAEAESAARHLADARQLAEDNPRTTPSEMAAALAEAQHHLTEAVSHVAPYAGDAAEAKLRWLRSLHCEQS